MDSAPWIQISACSPLTVKPTPWKQKQQLRSLCARVHITCMVFIQIFMSFLGAFKGLSASRFLSSPLQRPSN